VLVPLYVLLVIQQQFNIDKIFHPIVHVLMDGIYQEQPALNVMMFVLLAQDHHQIVLLVLNLPSELLLVVLVQKILLKLVMYVRSVLFLVQPVLLH
jgi:hypothetical protein